MTCGLTDNRSSDIQSNSTVKNPEYRSAEFSESVGFILCFEFQLQAKSQGYKEIPSNTKRYHFYI